MANRRRRAGTQSRQSSAPTSTASTQSSSPTPQLAPPDTGPAPCARRAAHRRAIHGATREANSHSESGEEIDLSGIGPDSGDEEVASVPSSDRAEPAADSLEPSPAQSVGSVQVTAARTDPRRANNVWHFFVRGSEKENRDHICRKCK